MTVMVEKEALRRIAHKLLDDVLDHAEGLAEEWRLADRPGLPENGLLVQRAPVKPSITLEGSAKKPAPPIEPEEGRCGKAKAEIRTKVAKTKIRPHPRPDVTMSCCWSNGKLRVAIHISAAVASRLGLEKAGHAEVRFPAVGRMTVRKASEGVAVLSYGGDRLTIQLLAEPFGILENRRAASVVHHFGLEDELVIALPTWWPKGQKGSPVVVSQPQARSGKNNGKKDEATCTDLTGYLGSHVRCVACGLKPATLECNLCHKLICGSCWESHVRTHWHAGHRGKVGTAARDARQAMRSQA